jgi:SAM-dependent methyltransferase
MMNNIGLIGGTPAYWFLKRFYPQAAGVAISNVDPFKARGVSKLATYFGPHIYEALRDKTVLDFGCGAGDNAIELALHGCRSVIGLDLQERLLAQGRAGAEQRGVAERVKFVTEYHEKVDVILSTDAFEHFSDPGAILKVMRGLIKDDGYVEVEFGPTWLHPLGGHLFSVFPWAHLLFTENSLIRWRSDFKTDGATRFHEVAGGLNGITLRRWEKLIAASDFRFDHYQLRPIRPAKPLHNRWTREFLTAIVRARLIPR